MNKEAKKRLYEAILKCDVEQVEKLLKQESFTGRKSLQSTQDEAMQFMLMQLDQLQQENR